jgi:hypothetical protein
VSSFTAETNSSNLFQEANANFISKNRQKQNRELLELEDLLSEEKKKALARKQLDLRLDMVRIFFTTIHRIQEPTLT